MLGEAHVIDVGGRILGVGESDGMREETEIVDAVGTFGQREE